MAPVKPMGVENLSGRNPKTKPGVTGFHQEYNQDPGPRQDLNPDAVADPSVLPKPLTNPVPRTSKPKAPRASRAKK